MHAQLLASEVTSREQTTLVQQQAADPQTSGLRFLYVTPERVAKSKMLLSKLQKAHLAHALVRIAIDDVGTGFSGLVRILDLPIDILKIDKQFVHGLPDDARSITSATAASGQSSSRNWIDCNPSWPS